MDDTFRELTEAETRATLLQFMGQTHGELFSLNQNIVTPASTLQPAAIDHKKVLEGINFKPDDLQNNRSSELPVIQAVPASPGFNLTKAIAATKPIDTDQLEFDFDKCHYSIAIFDQLKEINKHLQAINLTIQDLSKKKNTENST